MTSFTTVLTSASGEDVSVACWACAVPVKASTVKTETKGTNSRFSIVNILIYQGLRVGQRTTSGAQVTSAAGVELPDRAFIET